MYNGQYASDIDMINSLQIHAGNTLILWLDFLLSAERLYYKGCFWPILFGTIYTIWTVVFELAIGFNEERDPYLYSDYDWSDSMTPIAYYLASAVTLTIFTILATFIKNIILICSGVGNFKFDRIDEEVEDDSDNHSDDTLL